MKNILVVDDNADIADLVETILGSASYSCTKANSGWKCLELVSDARNHYDLILMDVAMPGLTGIDVLNKLRESDALKDTKILFFTASSITESDREDFKRMGALDCMKKPFTKADLLQFITKYAT
jgi:two-component system phosphate regulon response regulator PhoB